MTSADFWRPDDSPLLIARSISCSSTARRARSGSVNVNVVPSVGSLWTRIVLPCNSTKRFASASPRPVPLYCNYLETRRRLGVKFGAAQSRAGFDRSGSASAGRVSTGGV